MFDKIKIFVMVATGARYTENDFAPFTPAVIKQRRLNRIADATARLGFNPYV